MVHVAGNQPFSYLHRPSGSVDRRRQEQATLLSLRAVSHQAASCYTPCPLGIPPHPDRRPALPTGHRLLLGPAGSPKQQQPQGALPASRRGGAVERLPQASRSRSTFGLLPRSPAHLCLHAQLGELDQPPFQPELGAHPRRRPGHGPGRVPGRCCPARPSRWRHLGASASP